MKTRDLFTAFVLLAAVISGPAAAQSDREKEITNSFNKTVSSYIPANIGKKIVLPDPCPEVKGKKGVKGTKSFEGWDKQYSEPSTDYSIDIKKTDSIISPYLGAVEFVVYEHHTACHKTQSDAEADDVFIRSASLQRFRYTFAFQGDAWVLKSRELKGETGTWYPY